MAAPDVVRPRRRTSTPPRPDHPGRERGFTLVEVLIAIVLVGILATVVVVGIGRLTEHASAATCAASADASRVATNTYYAGSGSYPTSFTDLTSSGASGPLLVLPAGATAAGRTISSSNWTLTMSATTPPTYTCSNAVATATTAATTVAPTTVAPTTVPPTTVPPTTAAPTTAAAPVPNGVTASARANGDGRYYGESIITLSNASPITALSVTVDVALTTGLSFQGQYSNFWSGTTTTAHTTPVGSIRYTFDTVAGQTIVAGSWTLVGQFNGTGASRSTAGDTWTITSTSAGVTNTISGTF